nr:phosphomevalonate kinase, peroxisomal-like [Tanacetum cinerariifolium]
GAQHQETLDVVHIIAQTAHCMAQGKVGSGFDVSSAVFGSHRYVRFSPEVISSAQNAIRSLPLEDVVEEHWDTYNGVIYNCSMHQSEKWIEQASEAISLEIVKALHGARDAMINIRCHMREMGKAAGIPIEPESQTQLLDATMNMPGVLLAGVPGAGGFDAVFAVTLGDSGNNLINAWSSHNSYFLPLSVP